MARYLRGAGADPFPGTSPFDGATLERLDAYVAEASTFLLRGEWDVAVSRGVPTGDTAIAETFIRDSAPEAVIAFAGAFFEYPEPYRRKVVVHELLHAALNRITKYARDVVDGELGHTAEAIFEDSIAEHEEQVIDRLARAIAPLMPVSPEPSG